MDNATTALITSAVAVGGTLLGVVVTQWSSGKRERERIEAEDAREDARSEVEREREREARLFDIRREIYADVIARYHFWVDVAEMIERGEDSEPPEDAMASFWEALSQVELYGSQETADASLQLYYALSRLVYSRRDDDQEAEAMLRLRRFVDAARVDLGVPARVYPAGRPFRTVAATVNRDQDDGTS